MFLVEVPSLEKPDLELFQFRFRNRNSLPVPRWWGYRASCRRCWCILFPTRRPRFGASPCPLPQRSVNWLFVITSLLYFWVGKFAEIPLVCFNTNLCFHLHDKNNSIPNLGLKAREQWSGGRRDVIEKLSGLISLFCSEYFNNNTT